MSENDTLAQITNILADVGEYERKALDDESDAWYEREVAKGKTAKQIEAELARIREADDIKLSKKARQRKMEDLKEISEKSLDLDERNEAKKQLHRMENAQKLADTFASNISKGITDAYNKITEAAKYYSNLVENIQTRLVGSSRDFDSISKKMAEVFAVSPFFSMKAAMDKTSEFINQGILYNIETRASMAVISEKISKTFNAFDSSLLRLIRIQQTDSTQARLGMSNILTAFLNNQYEDSSYMTSLSNSVSSQLLEATSRMSKESALAFDFAVQKWLGSFHSLGVSDSLTTTLASAMASMGSGDLSTISSNSSLQALLVSALNRGGGKSSFSDIITGSISPDSVDDFFKGFLALMREIEKSSDNLVVLNQYAKVFGISVSDLTAAANNLKEANIDAIDSLNHGYADMITRVEEQSKFNVLLSRTGGAHIVDTFMENMYQTAGRQIGKDVGGYFAWQAAGLVNQFLAGISTGVEVAPFGVGTSIELKVGEITKAATVAGALAAGLGSISGNLSSLKGINLGALKGTETVSRGDLLSLIGKGTNDSSVISTVNFDPASIGKQASDDATENSISNPEYEEEKARAEETQQLFKNMDNSLKVIVQQLGIEGIVIREDGKPSSINYDILYSMNSNKGTRSI